MIANIKKTWAATVVGLASLTVVAALGTLSDRSLAEEKTTDVSHMSLLKIGYNDRLPAERSVMIGLNKTMIVELPRDLRDVVVSNPDILDAVVQTSTRVFLIGKKVDTGANVFFFDENGERMLTLEVKIEYDTGPLERLIERVIPNSHVKVEILNDTAVITGSVRNPADAARVADITQRFVTRPAIKPGVDTVKVINLVTVEANEQVMVKVQVAEVAREVIKRLGVNWTGASIGDSAIGLATNNKFPVSGGFGTDNYLFGVTGPGNGLGSCLIPGGAGNDIIVPAGSLAGVGSTNCLARTIQAFERTGLLKTLAEPTLTAVSGETANFLAGGEFPIPVATKDNTITVEWKPFGVGLSFTPLVLSEGRISLKVNTEVSELTTDGAVSSGLITISALKVRRAATTVELPSGGALVMAGLIREDTRQGIDGVPGLKNLPVLGALFRSRDFLKRETELVVIVTPYTVNPVSPNDLAKPTDGLVAASDLRASFLGQMNKIYGRREELPAGHYEGNYGFIVE